MKDAKCTEGHRISRAPSKGQNLLFAKIVKGMRYRDWTLTNHQFSTTLRRLCFIIVILSEIN